MSEAAMMSEAENRVLNFTKHIQVGSLRGQCDRDCGQRRLAIQSRARHAGAGEKVSNGFQSINDRYAGNFVVLPSNARDLRFEPNIKLQIPRHSRSSE